jgi:hypothetical protein
MSNPTANVLYSTPSARLDTVGSFTYNQIEVWMMIRSAHADFRQQIGLESTTDDFVIWLKDQWGIQIRNLSSGIDKNYEVIDEEKYLLFVLKWSP